MKRAKCKLYFSWVKVYVGRFKLKLKCTGFLEIQLLLAEYCSWFQNLCKGLSSRHENFRHDPTSKLHPIVKRWPFRGWAMDLIGQISLPSSRLHTFIIVATSYFIEWVGAKSMWIVEQSHVIDFVKENSIHRFSLPEMVIANHGSFIYRWTIYELCQETWHKIYPFNFLLCSG